MYIIILQIMRIFFTTLSNPTILRNKGTSGLYIFEQQMRCKHS